MDASQLYDKIISDLADRIERLEAHILDGSPSDIIEYKSLTRARQELKMVYAAVKEVYTRAVNEDEDDG